MLHHSSIHRFGHSINQLIENCFACRKHSKPKDQFQPRPWGRFDGSIEAMIVSSQPFGCAGDSCKLAPNSEMTTFKQRENLTSWKRKGRNKPEEEVLLSEIELEEWLENIDSIISKDQSYSYQLCFLDNNLDD